MYMKTKLLLVGSVPPPYHGSTVYFSNLLNSEIRNSFEVIHLDTSDHRSIDNLSRLDFKNVYLGLKNLLRLFFLLVVEKPQLSYVPIAASLLPYLRDGLFIAAISGLSRSRIIVHLHGGSYFREQFYKEASPIVRSFVRWTLRRVDIAIVLSPSLRPVFRDLVDDVRVVENGAELVYSEDEIRTKFVRRREKIIVGYLGNLIESKGVLDLIRSAGDVLKTCENIEFKVAGSWWGQEANTKSSAFQFLNDSGIQRQFEFLGNLEGEAKRRFLLDVDIFVFPSWYPFEGVPLVLLEAMAAGCPTVSTRNVGAISDVVLDGVTGCLVEPHNPSQLAQAILQLAKDESLRHSFGRAAEDRFREYYTFKVTEQKMLGLFSSALESI